jgi:hypothetical protein
MYRSFKYEIFPRHRQSSKTIIKRADLIRTWFCSRCRQKIDSEPLKEIHHLKGLTTVPQISRWRALLSVQSVNRVRPMDKRRIDRWGRGASWMQCVCLCICVCVCAVRCERCAMCIVWVCAVAVWVCMCVWRVECALCVTVCGVVVYVCVCLCTCAKEHFTIELVSRHT